MKKLNKEEIELINKIQGLKSEVDELEAKKKDVDFVTDYEKKLSVSNSVKLEEQRKNKFLTKKIIELESEIDFRDQVSKFNVKHVQLFRKSNSKGIGIVNTNWSDWHFEEEVKSSEVLGYNSFNIGIAEKRTDNLLNTFLRLVEIDRCGIKIPYCVLDLFGDFFSSFIHDELIETNNMTPAESVIYLTEKLCSMISAIIGKGKFEKIRVICLTGNHSRYTKGRGYHYKGFPKKTFEWILYHNIAKYFDRNNKVEFIIPDSTQYIDDQFGYKIRGLHGHQFKYNGGIGGAIVSINRKLLRWNKKQNVYLTVGSHLHEYNAGKDYIGNGSLVGYNQFALDNGYEYQPPIQSYFVISKKLGLIVNRPIYV
jgi:hypothetical protein